MRIISLDKGQFDTDREKEVVLAYMADYNDPLGGPVFIAVYDIKSETGMPVLKDSLSAVMLYPELYNANSGLARGSHFDIATADLNQDGMDEIVLTAVTPLIKTILIIDMAGDWMLIYINSRMEKLPKRLKRLILSTAEKEIQVTILCAWRLQRGNFDNDFHPDIAMAWELRLPSNGDSEFYLRVIAANTDSITKYGNIKRIDGSNGNNGWPMSIKSGDFDLDGRDEIQLAARNNLRAYTVDDELNVGSSGNTPMGVSLSTNREDRYSETFAVADMDIGDNDTLKTEIITYDNYGIRVHQKRGYTFGNDLVGEIEIEADAIIDGDFDGDALRFGPPERQTRTDIIQPIMVLSSPPLHIDVFDGVVYDLQDCYPVNDVTNITVAIQAMYRLPALRGAGSNLLLRCVQPGGPQKPLLPRYPGKKGFCQQKLVAVSIGNMVRVLKM